MVLEPDHIGLACAAGGFHIDPWRPAPLAVITHAHGDHARWGSGRYVCAAACVDVLRLRLPPDAVIQGVPWGETVQFGAATASFHPAGHIRGSAQVRVEVGGEVWVAAGDYKRAADPTCEAFEVVPCDVFITESTFALPIYRWQPSEAVAREIAQWWAENAAQGKASVLFCYSLGKAQRVLGELWRLGATPAFAWVREKTVFLHGAVEPLTRVYRDAGVEMVATARVSEEGEADTPPENPVGTTGPPKGKKKGRSFAGELAIAPPSASGSPWMRRFGSGHDFETGFASGWMRVRGIRRRGGYDRGFVLSDHADWDDLLRTIRETGARRVLATHGSSEALARYLGEQGIEAGVVRTGFGAAKGGHEEEDITVRED